MSRRLAVLFTTALVGVLAVVGIVVAQLGVVALAAYLLVVGVGVVLLVRRARSLARREAELAGRTCTCCTSTVFDPVEVR